MGTETRSNRKLLIVPCFLWSNLGLYLSISLLRVSLIMKTKHKCGACQANSTTAGLPAVAVMVETVRVMEPVTQVPMSAVHMGVNLGWGLM